MASMSVLLCHTCMRCINSNTINQSTRFRAIFEGLHTPRNSLAGTERTIIKKCTEVVKGTISHQLVSLFSLCRGENLS